MDMIQTYDERLQELTNKHYVDIADSFNDLVLYKSYGILIKTDEVARLASCTAEHIRKQERNGYLTAVYTDNEQGAKRFVTQDVIRWAAWRKAVVDLEKEENQ